MTISSRLKKWRKMLDVTQIEFCEQANIPLGVLKKYEAGTSIPGGETLSKMANTGLNIHWLLTGEGVMNSTEQNLNDIETPKKQNNKVLRMQSRIALVGLCQSYIKECGLKFTPACQEFVARWNTGEIEVEPWLKEALPTVSHISLRNWIKTIQKQGAKALSDKYGKRKSKIDTNPQMYALVTGMLAEHPSVSAVLIHEALLARFGEEQALSLRAVQDWLQKWKKKKEPAKVQNKKTQKEDKQCGQTAFYHFLLQKRSNLQQYEKRLEAILGLMEGIENEDERDALISEIFARVSSAKQLDELKHLVAELTANQAKTG